MNLFTPEEINVLHTFYSRFLKVCILNKTFPDLNQIYNDEMYIITESLNNSKNPFREMIVYWETILDNDVLIF